MSSKRPRILFIAHDTERSGAPRVTLRLAEALRDRGYAVGVCFPRRGGLEEEARGAGIETLVVPNRPVAFAAAGGAKERLHLLAERLLTPLRTARLARRWRADVVWAGSTMAILGALGGWLARCPVVLHVHEDLVLTRANRARIWLARHCASAIVFVARKSRPAFGRRPRGARWHLMPNFIDAKAVEAATRSNSFRAALGAGPENVVILTAAFLTPRKGLDVLLDAFARLGKEHPQARLWIAGGEVEGQEEYAHRLRERAEQPGCVGNAAFLGHREDVAALMKNADVFVLASRNEALPLTIAEAMRAGLPVVATRVGSVEDMVEDGKTGSLVAAEDAAALAAALDRYAADGALRAAHGAAGARRARKLYDREAILDRAEAILRSLRSRKT